MRRLQFLLLLLGVGLFVFVVRKAGLGTILLGLRVVGWSFAGIFALELVIDLLHSEAWRWCFPRGPKAVSRFDTVLARTAGVAVNVLTPTATVGGEVVKGLLLRRWMPLSQGFASVMIDKLTFALGQAIFLCAGTTAVLTGLSFDLEEQLLSLSVLGLWIVAVLAFLALQKAGIVRVGLGVMSTIFGGSGLADRLPGEAAAFDTQVSNFLSTRPRELVISIALHVVAQFARVPQYYFAMSALGLDPSAATCFTSAAGLVFMEATMFLIPAKLGVFEGGNALIFSRLGYGVTDGIIVSFAMRLSEMASALLGLLALAYLHFQEPAAETPVVQFPRKRGVRS
jgi:hypothetical protein